MQRILPFSLALLLMACSSTAVVKPGFDFSTIRTLSVASISDSNSYPGSGNIVYRSLVHQLMRLGIQVVERNDLSTLADEAALAQTLATNEYDLDLAAPDALLICTINEFSDGNVITIPTIKEDKGHTITTTTETTEPVANSTVTDNNELITKITVMEEITDFAGSVTHTERLEYINSRVGITLQMVHKETGEILWSNSYWYNALSLTYTVGQCVSGAVKPLKKILPAS